MDSWELFESDFKQGDEVIIVDDCDLIDFGILSYDDKGFTLSSGLRPKRYYIWEQCTFMAKDGFPVKKVFGTFPKGKDIENKQRIIRAAFSECRLEKLRSEVRTIEIILNEHKGICIPIIEKLVTDKIAELRILERESTKPWDHVSVASSDDNDSDSYSDDKRVNVSGIRFGCPFETDAVSIQIYNAGGYGDQYDLTPYEEVIRMSHINGTYAQLWQLTSVFDF